MSLKKNSALQIYPRIDLTFKTTKCVWICVKASCECILHGWLNVVFCSATWGKMIQGVWIMFHLKKPTTYWLHSSFMPRLIFVVMYEQYLTYCSVVSLTILHFQITVVIHCLYRERGKESKGPLLLTCFVYGDVAKRKIHVEHLSANTSDFFCVFAPAQGINIVPIGLTLGAEQEQSMVTEVYQFPC